MRFLHECGGTESCVLQYVANKLSWASYEQAHEYMNGGMQTHPTLATWFCLLNLMRIEVCASTRIMPPSPARLEQYQVVMHGLDQRAKRELRWLIRREMQREQQQAG